MEVRMAVVLLARQRIREVRELIKHNRAGALADLEDMFRAGAAPGDLLDGRYSGQLILTTYYPAIDHLARLAMTSLISWKGSSFDVETGIGETVLGKRMERLLRVAFPRYSGTQPDGPDRCRAFSFTTTIGASLHYPDQDVLVADYCSDDNPG